MATKSKKKATSKKAASAQPQKLAATQAAQSVRRINFTNAQVRPGFVPNTYFLIVSGTKPCINMQVHLSPLIYIRRPEYWGIEVLGTLSGPCLTAIAPYHVFLPLDGIIGTKGIEVIGATKKKKIKIPQKQPTVNPSK
jgi:hypothetical protein